MWRGAAVVDEAGVEGNALEEQQLALTEKRRALQVNVLACSAVTVLDLS